MALAPLWLHIAPGRPGARLLRFSARIASVALACPWICACAAIAVGTPSAAQFTDDSGTTTALFDASVDASSCFPGSVATFVPLPYHSASAPENVCVPVGLVHDPIALFYDDCFGPHASKEACQDLSATPAFAACARCIETPTSADTYGPLVVDPAALVAANVSGCIELADPFGLPCAKAVQAQGECDVAACEANCPVFDSASLGQYQACAAQARQGGCLAFATAGVCGDAGAAKACSWPTFKDFYDHVVPLFCASPPPVLFAVADAATEDGGPLYDASDGALETGVDASSDAGFEATAPRDARTE